MFDSTRRPTFEEYAALYYSNNPQPTTKKNFEDCFSDGSAFDSGSTADNCSTPGLAPNSINIEFDENDNCFEEIRADFDRLAFTNNNTLPKQNANLLKPKKIRKTPIDRFIPNRKTSRLPIALSPIHDLNNSLADVKKFEATREEDPHFSFNCLYKNLVLNYDPVSTHSSKTHVFTNTNLFRYNDENQGLAQSLQYGLNPLEGSDKVLAAYQTDTRKVAKVPFKVLDAPALQDDFYLNLVDWSSQNILGVGLSSCVYLWSAHTSKVSKLCDLGASDTVTSIGWATKGTQLGVGTNSGDVQIWDVVKMKKVRVLSGHTARVGALAWSSSLLTSGSRDKNIHNRDLRCNSNYISTLVGHRQEVCGLKWSFDEQQLASGGNDNKLYVWNAQSPNPQLKFTNHTAAVKALAWSPHQHGLLVSGGGTADRTIRFWNTLSNQQINCIDTGSQVCNLMFAKNHQELVSTHGYSQNQIVLWKYPTMDKVATLTGHSYRVLYLAMSPDGETIVTGAGDETLRFWNAFPSQKKNEAAVNQINKLKPSSFDLR